jgi:beta-glucosidase
VPPESLLAEAVRVTQQADVVVLCLGLTAGLEGEEMPVQTEGFRGGDRTSIDLPAAQERLLERIVAVGKPTVLVLMSGSAVAINWAQEHVPAIIEAWYGGRRRQRAVTCCSAITTLAAGCRSRSTRAWTTCRRLMITA